MTIVSIVIDRTMSTTRHCPVATTTCVIYVRRQQLYAWDIGMVIEPWKRLHIEKKDRRHSMLPAAASFVGVAVMPPRWKIRILERRSLMCFDYNNPSKSLYIPWGDTLTTETVAVDQIGSTQDATKAPVVGIGCLYAQFLQSTTKGYVGTYFATGAYVSSQAAIEQDP